MGGFVLSAPATSELSGLHVAADRGEPSAQSRLGLQYLRATNAADVALGAEWLRKAAAQGLAEAQFNIGYPQVRLSLILSSLHGHISLPLNVLRRLYAALHEDTIEKNQITTFSTGC